MNSLLDIAGLRLRVTCVLAVISLLPLQGSATIRLFKIDPAQTSLALQGRTGTGIWQEQGPGSLTATFEGWLVVDFQDSTIQFLQANCFMAVQTNSWMPGAGGSGTLTSASYGAKAVIGSGITAINETVAVRNLAFEIASPPLATGNGPMNASTVTLTISSTLGAALDYRADGLVVQSGSRALGGLTAMNATTGAITAPIFFEVQTLTVPIDISFTAQVLTSDDTTLHFIGTVVAQRGIMILNRQLLWFPSATNRLEFTLIWDGTFKLQRATTLALPDWADFASNAPVVISASGPSAFFRAALP